MSLVLHNYCLIASGLLRHSPSPKQYLLFEMCLVLGNEFTLQNRRRVLTDFLAAAFPSFHDLLGSFYQNRHLQIGDGLEVPAEPCKHPLKDVIESGLNFDWHVETVSITKSFWKVQGSPKPIWELLHGSTVFVG